MNYEEMSDFEINGYVSMHMHGFSWIEFVDGCASHVKCGNDRSPGFAMIEVSDYCNNPSDAWPIILANKIAVCPYDLDEESEEYEEMKDMWFAMKPLDGTQFDHKNPLRAAMIVFLMMEDAKNAD